jgi:hypothetical protein
MNFRLYCLNNNVGERIPKKIHLQNLTLYFTLFKCFSFSGFRFILLYR